VRVSHISIVWEEESRGTCLIPTVVRGNVKFRFYAGFSIGACAIFASTAGRVTVHQFKAARAPILSLFSGERVRSQAQRAQIAEHIASSASNACTASTSPLSSIHGNHRHP